MHRINKTKVCGHKNSKVDMKARSINIDKNGEKMTKVLNKYKRRYPNGQKHDIQSY